MPHEVGTKLVASRHAKPAGKGHDVARCAKRIIRVAGDGAVGQRGRGGPAESGLDATVLVGDVHEHADIAVRVKRPATEAILEFSARLNSQQRVGGMDPIVALMRVLQGSRRESSVAIVDGAELAA